MTKKPTIFIYGRNASYAVSYSRIAYDIAIAFYEKGWNVYNLGLGAPETHTTKFLPFEIVPIPEQFRSIQTKDDDPLLRYLENNFHLPEPDIVLIVEDIGSATASYRLKNLWPDAKYIMYTMFDAEQLGLMHPFDVGLFPIRSAFKELDGVIVPTTFSFDIFNKFGIRPKIIPLYYDDNLFTSSNDIEKPDRYTVLSIARNTDRKNLGNILYGMAINDIEDIVFRFRTELMIHDATSIDIRGMIHMLGIADNTMFESFDATSGHTNAELIYSYNNAHLSIYPSSREGFCLPALEAMACGLPVIVTANTAMDSWVPKFLPRFEPATIRFAGGLTGVEQIVSPNEIINKVLEARDTQFNEKEITEYASEFTLDKFKEKLIEYIDNI